MTDKTGNTHISGTLADRIDVPTEKLGFIIFDHGELDK